MSEEHPASRSVELDVEGAPMSDAVTLTWRQYRLERKMFWRNPSAAFFNFVLPLLFLSAAGRFCTATRAT